MKKILMIILAFSPLLGKAQNGAYTLTVNLKKLQKPAKAYLAKGYGWSDQKLIDSTQSNNGVFTFKGTVDEPGKVHLVIDHTNLGYKKWNKDDDVLMLFLEQGTITVNGTDSVKHAKLTGPAVNTEYKKYHAEVQASPEEKMQATNAAFVAAPEEKKKDKAFVDAMVANYHRAVAEQDSLKKVYINKNSNSYLSLMALMELTGNSTDKAVEYEPAFNSLSAEVKSSKTGQVFTRLAEAGRPTALGAIAPNFTENDVNGKPVTLSDFRGKYVLLDFWASWCGPCRAENPTVVKAYNKYKDKNFTVLGVSLDQPGKKEAWLAAIKADGLNWPQVSDLKSWNSDSAKKYAIRAIPQNFLIDPNGKIVAKNLRGEALEKKLEELIKL